MDMLDLARYIAGLLIILGLLAGFAVLLRIGAARGLIPGALGQANTYKRMKINETLVLDPRRRLLLVQIDQREHIILLGAQGEQVLGQKGAPPAFEPDFSEIEEDIIEADTPSPSAAPKAEKPGRPSLKDTLKKVWEQRS